MMGDQNAPERLAWAIRERDDSQTVTGDPILASRAALRGLPVVELVAAAAYDRAITERDEEQRWRVLAERRATDVELARDLARERARGYRAALEQATHEYPSAGAMLRVIRAALAEGEQPEYDPGAMGVGESCELGGDVHGAWCDHEGEQPAGETAQGEVVLSRIPDDVATVIRSGLVEFRNRVSADLPELTRGQCDDARGIAERAVDLGLYTLPEALHLAAKWCHDCEGRGFLPEYETWGRRVVPRRDCIACEGTGRTAERSGYAAGVQSTTETNAEACRRCGRSNVSWCAPSPLWNAAVRAGQPEDARCGELLCMGCFAEIAEKRGVASGWRLDAADVQVELETVSPSGRVWNPETWLWEKPPAAGAEATKMEKEDLRLLARLDDGECDPTDPRYEEFCERGLVRFSARYEGWELTDAGRRVVDEHPSLSTTETATGDGTAERLARDIDDLVHRLWHSPKSVRDEALHHLPDRGRALSVYCTPSGPLPDDYSLIDAVLPAEGERRDELEGVVAAVLNAEDRPAAIYAIARQVIDALRSAAAPATPESEGNDAAR